MIEGIDLMSALKGIRIVDLSQVMAGPYCSMLLADMGADVIKIEPPTGENTRRWPPHIDGESAAFMAINRNKRSMTLNLKDDEDKKIFYKLIETADVLVENYRPGVVKRLGVDYDTLNKINPRLVYCSISGFGQYGPYSTRGGYDLIAQGMTGIMSVTGERGGNPVKCGLPITDLGVALFAAYGILSALYARVQSNEGQFIDASLFDTGLALSVWESTQYWVNGETPEPTGSGHRLSAPYQAFQASDGYFTVGADTPHHWPVFCHIIGRPEFLNDERFVDDPSRIKHLKVFIQLIEEKTSKRPRSYWLEKFEEVGIPAGPINSYPESLTDSHAISRRMVEELEHPIAGKIKALGIPIKLSKNPGQIRNAAPLLGQHTEEILKELGLEKSDQSYKELNI
ncbi:CaiB/BaiF CoA transferase family protein [Peribacillus butanolivorans]|uniref:CaiB/BaiF CoA transferase family protein n=1 Tax=Peribacillus butanolivorans TaxID=421767 RepID=UPI001CBEE87F|nr:CoA transferase [Peribacillus butanolivorans]